LDAKTSRKEGIEPQEQDEEEAANPRSLINVEYQYDKQHLQNMCALGTQSTCHQDPLQKTPTLDDHMRCSNVIFVGESSISFTLHWGDLISYGPKPGQDLHKTGHLGL
jgi:hypothetical protein